jgi:hypothetical protein
VVDGWRVQKRYTRQSGDDAGLTGPWKGNVMCEIRKDVPGSGAWIDLAEHVSVGMDSLHLRYY